MTRRARITYADVLRTMKALKAADIKEARVVMHLELGEIEVVIGGVSSADAQASHRDLNEWADI